MKHMRWGARILGVLYSISIIWEILRTFLELRGYESHYIFPLFTGFHFLYFLAPGFALFIALIPVIMLGIAWKKPGRWPELAAGVIFTAWGLALLAGTWVFIASPSVFGVLETLIVVCPPLIPGILFILVYKMTRSVKS